jgi:hypothetical protein
LIETVTVAIAPEARVPDVAERVVQDCVFVAVQSMGVPPVFSKVYARLAGVNGPPSEPEDASPPAGVTERIPGGGVIVRVTARVVSPLPLVVFVNETASL